MLATNSLGNIIEVVSHSKKNSKHVSGEIWQRKGNVAKELLTICMHR